jgi:Papain family cysteine protease
MQRRDFTLTLVSLSLGLKGCGGGGGGTSGGGSTSNGFTPIADALSVKEPGNVGTRLLSDAELALIRKRRPTSAGFGNLPAKVDNTLLGFLPAVGNQGAQGSCTAWATAHGLATFYYCKGKKLSPTESANIASTADMYAKILEFERASCNDGTWSGDALEILRTKGIDSQLNVPYTAVADAQSCVLPSKRDIFKIASYEDGTCDALDVIKLSLRDGNVLALSMRVTERFRRYWGQKGVFKAATDELAPYGHAMLIVGYDDSLNAVKVMNSWSAEWADSGYVYIDYDTLAKFGNWVGIATPVSYVTNSAPAISLISTSGTTVNVGNSYSIGIKIDDIDSNASYLEFDWRDGSSVDRVYVAKGLTTQNKVVFRAFDAARMINWQATAFDSIGRASNSLEGSFSVVSSTPNSVAPSLRLTNTSGASIVRGSAYSLTFASEDSDGDLAYIELNWNDGSAINKTTLSGKTAATRIDRVFAGAGKVQWSAIAFDAGGRASNTVYGDVQVIEALVNGNAPQLKLSTSTGASVTVGSTYTLQVYATDLDSNLSYVTLNWNDGSNPVSQSVSGGNAYATFSRPFSANSVVNWTAYAADAAGMKSGNLTGSFSVVPVPVNLSPTIASFYPATLVALPEPQTVVVFGTNFASNSTIRAFLNGVSQSLLMTIVNSNQLSLTLNTGSAGVGRWTFEITSNGSTVSAQLDCTVLPAAPVISSLTLSGSSRTEADGGKYYPVVVRGTNFSPLSKIRYENFGLNFVAASNRTNVISTTEITVDLKILGDSVGAAFIQVENPGNSFSNISKITFPNLSVVPEIISMNRSVLSSKDTLKEIVISGTGFLPGCVVWYTRTLRTVANINDATLYQFNPNRVTQSFTNWPTSELRVDLSDVVLTAGMYYFTVFNTSGGQFSNAFSINCTD